MEIKLTIGATPELLSAIEKIADALTSGTSNKPVTNNIALSSKTEKATKPKPEEKPALAETKAEETTDVTETPAAVEKPAKRIELADVRAIFEPLAKEKPAEAKALLTKYGAKSPDDGKFKLTLVKKEDYPAFMEDLKAVA